MNSLKLSNYLVYSVVGCILLSAPASANRRLKEPKDIRKAKKVSSSLLKAAVGEEELPNCKANLKKTDLVGMRCRLKVFHHKTNQAHKPSLRSVKKELAAAKTALKAGRNIAAYKPIKKKPGHRDNMFRAHREACAVALDVYDRMEKLRKTDIKPKVQSLIDEKLAGEKGLSRRACECARDTVVLAQTLDLPANERGALQGALTSRGCFLDKSKIAANRGGPKSQFVGKKANAIAQKSSLQGQMIEFANTRDLELNRCRDKWIAPGKIKDNVKAEKCLCGQMSRWKFPKERGRKDVTFALPLDKRFKIDVMIAANGNMKNCGHIGSISDGAQVFEEPTATETPVATEKMAKPKGELKTKAKADVTKAKEKLKK